MPLDLKKAFKLPPKKSLLPDVVVGAQTSEQPPGRAPDVDWASVVDTWNYHAGNEPDLRRKQGVFHPSSGLHHDTGACPRAVVFDLLFAPRSRTSKDSRLIRILDNGTNRHDGLHAYFQGMAREGFMGIVGYQTEPLLEHPDMPISGHADGIVTLDTGWSYLNDYKTCSPDVAKKTMEPTFGYKAQLNVYMGLAGLTAGYVLYESRGNCTFLGPTSKFRVDFDNKLWREQWDYCREMLAIANSGTMPEFSEATCKDCITFCGYQMACKIERETGVFPDHRPDDVKRIHLKVL